MDIEKIVNELSLKELIGQTFCLYVSPKTDIKELEKRAEYMRPGGIFFTGMSAEKAKECIDAVSKYVKLPLVVTSDIEDGPHNVISGTPTIPMQMALGACGDEALVEKAGLLTGQICRKYGVHWGFNPVVDLNLNFRSPECNVRSISDDADHVIKIASAYMKGFRKDGLMACSIKHFPGQGIDERNTHLSLSENSLSKSEWLDSYGKVYKELFKQGVDSVMLGHISLPAFQTEKDEFGYLPATISKELVTDLLKGELGFKGVVISDAMGMCGATCRMKFDDLPIAFLKAGGDMILFPKEKAVEDITNAVNSGELGLERLRDAVSRIIKLKDNLHLFEKGYFNNLEVSGNLEDVANKIAEKSLTVLRDFDNLLPVKLEKNSKVLMLNIIEPFFNKPPKGIEFLPLKQELESRGYTVDYIDNVGENLYNEVNKIKNNYDLILINSYLSSRNYNGGSMRVGWNSAMLFWDGYVLDHPRVVFTSFGDPYKIFDYPFVRTYINAYSNYKESQLAVVKLILGDIKAQGKSPVELKGYFNREV